MRHSSRSFIGHNSPNFWSQFWEGGLDNQILCLINISSDLSDNSSVLGHALIDKISSFDLTSSPDLSTAITQLFHSIKNDTLINHEKVSLSLAVTSGSYLHLGQLNSGLIYFQRKNNLCVLINNHDDSIKQIIGKVEDFDRLFFTSEKFNLSFPSDKLSKTLSLSSISTIEETFLSELVNLDDQNLVSAALIEFHPEIEEVTIPEMPTPQPVQVSHLPVKQSSIRKKIHIFVAILVLTLFSVSIIYGYRQNQIKILEKKYLDLESQIKQSVDQSLKLKPINLDNSQQAAQKAKQLIASIKLLKIHSDKISQLESTVDSLLVQSGSQDYKPENFYDTSLIAGKLNFSFIRYFSGKLYLLDSSSKLFSLNVAEKSHQLISDSDTLKNSIDFFVDKNQIYLLYPQSITIIKNGQPSGSLDFKGFIPTHFHIWNSNAYFLTSNNIYKSSPNNASFSPPQVWLKTDNSLPPQTSSIAINGSIWTITSNGQITSYTQGAKDKTISNLSPDIKSASRLQAAADYDKLVFTDGDNFVYIYNKSGESVSKFNLGTLKIIDIALDSSTNTVFVLCTDQKIYKISL